MRNLRTSLATNGMLRCRATTSSRWRGASVHRGPDDEGYYVSGPIGLGFRRLSIIDIEGGHQPMSDAEETIRVIFNGEIYNFPELARELESLRPRLLRTAATRK